MRRQHKQDSYLDIYGIFPLLFWQHCQNCNQDFVRERGWAARTGPYFGGLVIRRVVCGKCAPSKADANRIISRLVTSGIPHVY